jgi:hypothetical protein
MPPLLAFELHANKGQAEQK